MLSLSDDNQSELVEAFHSTSRCLDDLLNIDKHGQSYLLFRIQLNKASISGTEAQFLYLHLSISDRLKS